MMLRKLFLLAVIMTIGINGLDIAAQSDIPEGDLRIAHIGPLTGIRD